MQIFSAKNSRTVFKVVQAVNDLWNLTYWTLYIKTYRGSILILVFFFTKQTCYLVKTNFWDKVDIEV